MKTDLLESAVSYIKKATNLHPDILVVLGSGLGKAAEGIVLENSLSYDEIPGFKKTSAPTHKGNLLFGKISGHQVMIMQGRFHIYEGYHISEVVFPVDVAAALGVRWLISTNLSGGIRKDLQIGDLMVVEDHINLSGLTPLIGRNGPRGYFVNMNEAYSLRLRRLFLELAEETGEEVKKGVLAYMTGPSFETRAEANFLRLAGADAIGWSIVPEVLCAKQHGIEVLAVSCVSDISDPDRFGPVDLEKIFTVGINKTTMLKKLLERFIGRL